MLFFGPYLRRAVGKIVGKNSLWRKCRSQQEKSGKFKTVFSSRLGAEIMVFCAATNCTNRSKSKVRTFKFPADPKIPEEWLKNLKRESFQPTKHSRLCENHFTEESFDESYVIILSLGLKPGTPQLKKNAISTISNVANVGRDKKRRGTGQNESELSAFAKRRKLEVRQGFVSLLMLSLNTYRSTW